MTTRHRVMTRRMLGTTAMAASLLLSSSCIDSRIPDGVTCEATRSAGAASELSAALAEAAAGDCVLVDDGEYVGAFEVPASVKLIASADVSFRGDDPDAPAVFLVGAERSGLYGVHVSAAEGEGIRVENGPAELFDVEVTGASGGALVLTCEDACADDGLIEVRGAVLKESRFGLWVRGARVEASEGESVQHDSAALTSGYGVIASEGADLTLSGFQVAGNAQVGVLVDGEGTRSTLRDVDVSDNEGRGVFAQGLRGSSDEPALSIEGEGTQIEGNGVVGLGSVDSRGIIFVNGRVAGTLAQPVPTDLGSIEEVGDGVGLFEGTGDVRLDGVELASSARAQLLVDKGEVGIIFVNGEIIGELKAVIQDTPVAVAVPEGLVDDLAQRLGIQAERIELPRATN